MSESAESGYDRAFEKISNFIAVSRVGDPVATLAGAMAMVLAEFPDEHPRTAADLSQLVHTLFGVNPNRELEDPALSSLLQAGAIHTDSSGVLTLGNGERASLLSATADARALEDRVCARWLETLGDLSPAARAAAWPTLRRFMYLNFRRHGMQAVHLLCPSSDGLAEDRIESMTGLLGKALHDCCPKAAVKEVAQAVTNFMGSLGTDGDRSLLVSQLGDSAFNFYTLEVDPDVSRRLKSGLADVTLFLDTNFVFDVLGLHSSDQGQMPLKLLQLIRTHALPFKLRYHEKTRREIESTLEFYFDQLRKRRWQAALSRAAVRAGNLSGVELRYHEMNAVQPVDVEDYISKYEHFDVLLKDLGVEIYRTSDDRLEPRATLLAEYQSYLKSHGKPKTYEAIDHDTTVLDTVRTLRTDSPLVLDARALLMTCDFWLFRFDAYNSRERGLPQSVVLPNLLWQLLRPVLPSNTDFERTFAETFSMPEFRTIGVPGAASRAASSMMSVMATWADVPEETAVRLLTNAHLLSKVDVATDEHAVEELLENELVSENGVLLEERVHLERAHKLDGEARALAERRAQDEEAARVIAEERAQDEVAARLIAEKKAEDEEAARLIAEKKAQDEEAARLIADKNAGIRLAGERRAEGERDSLALTAASTARRLRIAIAILAGILLCVALEYVVHVLLPWAWLISHPNSLGIQFAAWLVVLGSALAIADRDARRVYLAVLVIGSVLALVTILGPEVAAPKVTP